MSIQVILAATALNKRKPDVVMKSLTHCFCSPKLEPNVHPEGIPWGQKYCVVCRDVRRKQPLSNQSP